MLSTRWTCLKLPNLQNAYRHRCYATSTQKLASEPSKIRNIALVAHIDSGKTTLTESILLKSSFLTSRGSVDTGSTTTDFLPAERERGITIQSASIPVKWKDWTFNLIDTPGHADFGMEVESASRVVDGAVVLIDSVEGVESQTKGVWRQLDRYDVPTRVVFLNKLDRPGASLRHSLASLLSHGLHPHPVALTLPIASFDPHDYALGEPGIQGLVDLVKWEVWKWDADNNESCHPLPRTIDALKKMDMLHSHPIIEHLVPARTALLENLSMFSEGLMETLLDNSDDPNSYLAIGTSTILPHLRQASLKKQILPVLCGSAMKNIGTNLVMDYVGELLASPLDVPHDPQGQNAPVQLLAWKVTWHKTMGWMTFVRVYSGKLKRQSVILNATRNGIKERVSKVLLLYASNHEEVEELPFGSVGVILGLKHTRTGDTLVSGKTSPNSQSIFRDITPPPAVIATSIIPQSHSDLELVQNALQALNRTDPSMRVDLQEGQILVHGLGALHLEIIEGRLRDEWNVNFEFGKRRVSYREGLGSGAPTEGSGTFHSDYNGKPFKVTVKFEMRPLEAGEEGDSVWDGNIVVDNLGKSLPGPDSAKGNAASYLAQGIASAISCSPHTSLAMSRVYIQVKSYDCSSSPGLYVPPSVLTGSSAAIMRDRIRAAGSGPLMEPFILLKISVDEDSLGRVLKDLTEHGGEVLTLGAGSKVAADGTEEVGGYSDEGVYIPPAWLSPSGPGASNTSNLKNQARPKLTVQAVAPLSRMLDYNQRLRSLSGGHGQFEMSNAGFKEVSEIRRQEIMREIGRA